MHFTCISDTHGKHRDLKLPGGEVLLHAGDCTNVGRRAGVIDFLDWFSEQNYEHKIFIAGNHDYFFERYSPEEVAAIIPDNVIYLNDSGIDLNGIKIWGSPVSPWFYDWAFNRRRGKEIQQHWDLIPTDTDILITHGPPFGILDKTAAGLPVGCEDLTKTLEKIKPKVHLFGHIHEAQGERKIDGTHYINASILDERYFMSNAPIGVTVDG